MQQNSISKFLNWVDSFLNFEKLPQKDIFWLDTMEFLCRELGEPQKAVPCFHVAGSKGKGSVSAMISGILTAAGKKVGVYSSPHIEDFRERIRLNNSFFTDEVYAKAADELYQKFNLEKERLPQTRAVTWFELVTVFAFLCFRQAQVDESVFEVGLGGRLDATNVVKPQIAVINTIELEHTEFLGDTVEKIAVEKAGIIKEGVPVLCAPQVESVREVFKKIAKEKNATIYFADELLGSGECCCNNISDFIKTEYDTISKTMKVLIESSLFSRPLNFNLKMTGNVQAQNAFLAAASVKITHPEIGEDVIEAGLSAVQLPARFEIVGGGNVGKPTIDGNTSTPGSNCSAGIGDQENIVGNTTGGGPDIILDGAHTVKSIGLTLDTLDFLYPEGLKDLLFACAADKDVDHMARLFAGRFTHVWLTKPGSTKSADPEKMKAAFKDAGIDFVYDDDYGAIIGDAIKTAKDEKHVLLITGSFYLASEVKKILKS